MLLTPRRIALLFALDLAVVGMFVLGLVDLRRRDVDLGVNQWGYRGQARAEKGPGPELRVAVLGGSAAFETGMPWTQVFVADLGTELQKAGNLTDQGFSVANLSEPNIGADSYPGILRHYRFLEPDILCIFDGYDDATGLPPHARERSAMFRLTGYLPLLPARALGRAAWLSDPDRGVAPGLGDQGGAVDVTCAGESRSYCAAMIEAVRVAVDEEHLPTVVVSPPAVSERYVQQQHSLASTLQATFGGNPRFRYLDVWEVDLRKRENSPDGVHRTAVGNHEVSVRIAKALIGWLAAGWGRR